MSELEEKINKALHGVIKPDEIWFKCDCSIVKFKSPDDQHYHNCSTYKNPDYFSKEGFWDVLNFVKNQAWYPKFILYTKGSTIGDRPHSMGIGAIHYKVFAYMVYSFLVAEGIIKGDG